MQEFENPDRWTAAATHYERTAHPFTALFAESALARVQLTPESDVLDVAAGTGALAFAAGRTGARVLAIDFSPGMIDRIVAANISNVEVTVMDGQTLELPDARFDAVFSIFGVIMFTNWRKGLAEMARVTRPGGYGIVGTWHARGAATFLLLSQVRGKLFPERKGMAMPEAVQALSDPHDFSSELVRAGYRSPQIEYVSHDYELAVVALSEPDRLFGMSPDWTSLSAAEKAQVVAELLSMTAGEPVLRIPSTALIGVAVR